MRLRTNSVRPAGRGDRSTSVRCDVAADGGRPCRRPLPVVTCHRGATPTGSGRVFVLEVALVGSIRPWCSGKWGAHAGSIALLELLDKSGKGCARGERQGTSAADKARKACRSTRKTPGKHGALRQILVGAKGFEPWTPRPEPTFPFAISEGVRLKSAAAEGSCLFTLQLAVGPRLPLLSHFTPHRRILRRRLLPSRGTVESSRPLSPIPLEPYAHIVTTRFDCRYARIDRVVHGTECCFAGSAWGTGT